jgi:hypothetical protein
MQSDTMVMIFAVILRKNYMNSCVLQYQRERFFTFIELNFNETWHDSHSKHKLRKSL